MPSPAFEIVTVKTGTKSLRCLQRKETFHPGIGPQEEAKILHVRQQCLVERAAVPGLFVLWDVGLGAAANAIAAMDSLRAAGHGARVEIHSFDISTAPLEFALENMDSLTYLEPYAAAVAALVRDGRVEVAPNLWWYFHPGDFREVMLGEHLPAPHSVFYDPYSPGTNREMWTLDHFTALYSRMPAECLLTNYTRSTAVRVTWLLAGFYVGVGDAIHAKDETSAAAVNPARILRPLDKKWLAKVKVSRNGAPIRGEKTGDVPISEEDYARLSAHPQFR